METTYTTDGKTSGVGNLATEQPKLKEYEVISIKEIYATMKYRVKAYSEEDAIKQVEDGNADVWDQWDEDQKEHSYEATLVKGGELR